MKKRKLTLAIGLFFILLIAILGVSYALLSKNIVGSNDKIIYKIGDLDVKLDESGSKDISLSDAMPTEDIDGLKSEPYSFLLVNNGTTALEYTIYLEDDPSAKNQCGENCELVPYNFLRYNISNDTKSLKTSHLASSSNEIYAGTINANSTDKFILRVWLSLDADNTAMNKYYFGKIKVVVSQGDTYCKDNGFNTLSDCMLVINNHDKSTDIAKTNIKSKGTPDFSKTATTDEGLYMAEDDEGESYYYRGAVKNNYVSFAGFIWRIIRRNGDGSVRMIYAGKSVLDTESDVSIGKSAFNSKHWDPTYLGYKYNEKFSLHENNEIISYSWFDETTTYNFGTGYSFDESTRKFTLTGTVKQLTWKDNHDEIVAGNLYSCLNTSCNVVYKITEYKDDETMRVLPISYSSDSYADAVTNTTNSTVKNKLDSWYIKNLSNYSTYLADETFCNDRSVADGTGYLVSPTTSYGAYNRLYENKIPSLRCTQDNDKFKVSNIGAKLDYPISLITADEVALAGGVASTPNSDFYLYSGENFWTLSPFRFESNASYSYVWYVHDLGTLRHWLYVDSRCDVRPVINLKIDTPIVDGDGTTMKPFEIGI